MREAQSENSASDARVRRLATGDRFRTGAPSGSRPPARSQFLGSFLNLVLSCFAACGEETSLAALTLDSEQAPARATSLLSDNFSISVTLDFVPDDSSELLSGSSIGYRRAGVASIRHLADPEETTNKLVFFRRHMQPGITSLAWGNFQAGYGRIFTDDSVITRGSNGTAWEEPGCLYLKTRFRF